MLDPASRFAPALELDITVRGTTTTVGVAGELDLAGVEQLDSAVGAALGQARETVGIPLSALTFMGSSGLRALLDAERRAGSHGGRLLIIPSPALVHAVVDLCRGDSL